MRSFFLLLLLPTLLSARNPDTARLATVDRFFSGYNRQDFGEMRSTLGGLMKAIFTEKMLRNVFEPQFTLNGRIESRLVANTSRGLRFEVRYAYDSTEWSRFSFVFDKKHRIIGFRVQGPDFRIPAADSLRLNRLRDDRMAAMDSLFNLKAKAGVFTGCVLVEDAEGVMHRRCSPGFDENTVFELASVSKQFTAVAVLQLVAAGKLQLEQEVRYYLPELPYKGVTVSMLLNHTGGIPDYMELLEKHWDHRRIATQADVLALLAEKKPKRDFKPGKKHEYSNTGYVLLACLVERVTGKPFDDHMREAVFVPAGMLQTRMYHRRQAGSLPEKLAVGLVWSDSLKRMVVPDSLPEYDYVYYLDGISGDGCVNSTLTDLQRWEKNLRSGSMLPDSLLRKAWEATRLPDGSIEHYGYGWVTDVDSAYVPLVHHSGSWPGYITYMLFTRDQPGLVIVLSANEYRNAVAYGRQLTGLLLDRR